ncbi:MAG: ABC transporter ATP-binding protein [Magnetococcales bacterium]|nr:ABC transporter ATP-binding protein [Magnetococcales bacterium]
MNLKSFVSDIFHKYPKLFIVNLLLAILAALADIMSIVFLAPIVEILAYGSFQTSGALTQKLSQLMATVGLEVNATSLLGIFLIFSFLRAGFQIWTVNTILKTKYAFMTDLIVGSFKDFFNSRWAFFSSQSQGTIINTLTRELNMVGDSFGNMARLFSSFIHAVVYAAIPFYISWKITLICIAAITVVLLPFLWMGKLNRRLGQRNTESANKISAVIQENLTLAKVILGFNKQTDTILAMEESYKSYSKSTIFSLTIANSIPLLYYPFGLVVLCLALFSAQEINVQLVDTVVLIYALFRVIPSMGSMAHLKASLDNFFPSYLQILELQNRAIAMVQPSGERQFTTLQKNIVFKDVSFSYPNGPMVLKNLDFNISKGSFVAFVGKSGVGKSSLLDLIMHLNSVDSGHILIDDTDLTKIDTSSYRKSISYVSQENLLFNTTVKANLIWACPKATKEEVLLACKKAHAHEFIVKLENGYDTLVGDRGVRLSGGQIQRLALARALLAKPDILLLDEATNSLDTQSERLIQESLEAVYGQTTIIVVTHRISTIINADVIFVLQEGELVQQGNYQELKNRPGPFHDMLQLQDLKRDEDQDSKVAKKWTSL